MGERVLARDLPAPPESSTNPATLLSPTVVWLVVKQSVSFQFSFFWGGGGVTLSHTRLFVTHASCRSLTPSLKEIISENRRRVPVPFIYRSVSGGCNSLFARRKEKEIRFILGPSVRPRR